MTEAPRPATRPSPDLAILETRVYRGANVWSYEKAIHLVVELGSLEDFPTNALPGFTDELLQMLPRVIGEHMQTLTRLEQGLWRVTADPSQMEQVLVNLVLNARDAMPTGGTITIETVREAAAGFVRIVVADDGPGIPAGEREKLFLPYYSTKGRGSGLGLAIVRRIVAEHGGSIDVADNVPHGTRFTIELPA